MGVAAASAVVMTLMVMAAFIASTKLLKDEDHEM